MSKQLKVFLDDELRAFLEKAADRRGVNLAQEIRARLWHSFATMPEITDVSHARKTAIYLDTWRGE